MLSLGAVTADGDVATMRTAFKSVRITGTQVNNNAVANTLQDVTGLQFPVVSGIEYYFFFLIPYITAVSTTGARFTLNGPAITRLRYRSNYTLTATSESVNSGLTAYNLPAASNASAVVAGNLAIIEGIILPSASGNVIARFASEVASSAITVQDGASVMYRAIS